MNLWKLLVFGVATIGTGLTGAACHAAGYAEPDALVAVTSRYLDELRLVPSVDLSVYRRIMIDPVQVGFRDDWLWNMNSRGRAARRFTPDDVRQFADELRSELQESLVQAFVQRGYDIGNRDGTETLRLSATARDLYVHAPDALSSPTSEAFTREAGTATLVLEAHDAVTGALLAVAVRHGTAEQMGRLERSSDVSTRFWFGALFSRWASHCAMELGAKRPRAQATLGLAVTQ